MHKYKGLKENPLTCFEKKTYKNQNIMKKKENLSQFMAL